MKILQVNKFNYLRGGAEKYFLEISKELEKRGHQVAVFSMHHPKNISSPWSKYFVSRISFNEGTWRDKVKSPFRILYSFEARKKFKQIIKDFQPDIIHLHNIYHQISPSILNVARKNKIPVIMHLHDYKLVCPNYQLYAHGEICYRCRVSKYYNCSKYRCFKNSRAKSFLATLEMYFHHKVLKIYKKNINHFIAPSEFMKKTVESFRWPEAKISVLYNFSEQFPEREDLTIENYGLYFGRLSPEKGIDLLLRAFKNSKSTLSLKIVGAGPQEEELKKMSQDLGLEGKVEFLGAKFSSELEDIIRRAKVIFLPSLWNENMPLVLLESLMLKKVVVASKTGGLPELVIDKKSGFLFENGSVDDLSRIINDLDNYDLEKISKSAYQIAQSLNVEQHIDNLVKIYEKVISQN